MIQKPELVKKIKYNFNLNIYESKVWLALLSKSIATVGEVAEISGVPRSRVYDVLESLEKRGFAIAKLGKPIKFIAVKPSVALEHLKTNLLNEAEERTKSLATIKETAEYRELELLYTKGIQPVQVEDLSTSIKGRKNIYSHLKELVGEAKKEVILVSTAEALKRKMHFLKPMLEKLKSNGIAIKIAVSNIGEDEKEKFGLIALSKEIGMPIKKIRINSRFCIVDGNKALIFVTPDGDEDNDIAIWINSPFFNKALTTFLSPVWHK